jgi:Domain of unknown function (DUF222)
MDSNTHSTGRPTRPPDGLTALATAVDGLAAQDLSGLADAVRAEPVLGLRWLLDRLEGRWLHELAAVDARGAAGADHDLQVGWTAGWLRPGWAWAPGRPAVVSAPPGPVPRPLAATAQALTDGQLSPAHAAVLAPGTQDLPHHLTAEAEPVLVEAAGRLDPPRLRQAVAHLREVIDPDTTGRPGRTPPCPAGPVAEGDPGGYGRPGRAVGTRSRPEPAGRVGAAGSAGQGRR